MVYYKIPIVDGVFDYPAGCLLCCAYPQGGYMFCKFETCPEVGSGWVEISEILFNENCPDFEIGTIDPLSNNHFTLSPTDITAGSSALETGKLWLVYE